MVEGAAPFYSLSNFGNKKNCTITAMFPAVITVRAINVGADKSDVNYEVSFNSIDKRQFHQSFPLLNNFHRKV